MSAVAKLLDVVSGDPVARAEAKCNAIRRKAEAAETKRAGLEAEITSSRESLRLSVGEESGDPSALAGKIGKLRADLAAAEELSAVLRDAAAEAAAGLAEVRARAEREALSAELAAIEPKLAAAVADFEEHLAPLSDALSRAFVAAVAAGRIREHLDLPPVAPLHAALNDVVRRLNAGLVAKHGDAHGRGIGVHVVEVPIHSPSLDTPTARRLGIV